MIFCEISSFTLVAPSIYSDSYNCALCAALGLGKPDEEDEEDVDDVEKNEKYLCKLDVAGKKMAGII